MSDAMKYWSDADFVYKIYPKVHQALVDGEEMEGEIFLIPDSRLIFVSTPNTRLRRRDIVPRVKDGELSWRLYGPVPGGKREMFNEPFREDLVRSARELSEASFRWLINVTRIFEETEGEED